MASSDNLSSMEPWLLRSAFASASDPWFSEAEILPKSVSVPAGSGAGLSHSDDSSLYDVLTSVVNRTSPNPDTPRGIGFGFGSGSDPETAPSKRGGRGTVSGRVGKRKPRASKKNPTTYITADAANFQRMVQQVTGVKFTAATQIPSVAAHILKPEPQRFAGSGGGFGGRMQGCLPTLDTSAFLFGLGGDVGSQIGAETASAAAAWVLPSAAEVGCDGGGAAGISFDGLSCYPTLDSWKAL